MFRTGLSGAAGRDEREAGRHDSCGRGRGCRSPGGYFLGTACLWPGVVEGISMVTTPMGPRGGGIKGGTEALVRSEAVRNVTARGEKGRVRSGGAAAPLSRVESLLIRLMMKSRTSQHEMEERVGKKTEILFSRFCSFKCL